MTGADHIVADDSARETRRILVYVVAPLVVASLLSRLVILAAAPFPYYDIRNAALPAHIIATVITVGLCIQYLWLVFLGITGA